ncbi:MAG: DUF1772 domain-containing protein [Vicinamibacterales bacterium]
MSDDVIFAVRLSSAIGCGLMAGLFFAFSVAVMRALSRLPAAVGMAAMQSINVAILNPVFLAGFLGTALSCLVVLVSSLSRWHEAGAVFFVVGAALYLVGACLITIVFNVPMNEALASTAPADPDGGGRWASYLTNWTAWNHVRTLAALAAAIVLTLALCRTDVIAPR